MKREDYIKKATARIFDSRQKRAVTAELEDHIAHRTAALEEIGYDPERAEAQGVEAMGDPAEICDQLGALHNRFYTPVWDIVFLLLWGGLLAGAYYALRQYVFGDVGLTALLNAGACLVPGCACLYGVWCLHQNHPVTAVLYALGLGGSGVYLYFLLQKLSATMGGRFANWQAFLFHQEILKHQVLYANDRAVAGGIAGLLAPGVLLLLAAVIYMLKKAALANTRLDNCLARVFGRVGAALGVLCLAATIALGVKAPADVRAFAGEYKAVYAYLLQVTQGAKDMDALCAEIEDSPYAFEIERTDDGSCCLPPINTIMCWPRWSRRKFKVEQSWRRSTKRRSPSSGTRWRSWAATRRWPRRLAAPMPNPPGSKRTAPRSAALCVWG